MPINKLTHKLVAFVDKDFPSIMEKREVKELNSMWQYCGYGKTDYHKFAYILPYTVPAMIILVNGFLIGILLAFFTFNGAMTGYQIFGIKGITIGIFYNVVYFAVAKGPVY